MSDIAIIDELNRHIRFDAKGGITGMDKTAALAALDRMQHRPLAAELRRCVELGDFSDNHLMSKSDHGAQSGLMVALMSTPYVKHADDTRHICLHAVAFEDIVTLAPLRVRYPAPNIRPVAMTGATAHIRDVLRFVALFPDSILGSLPPGYADGFYFREKFVQAFETCIRPLLDALWVDGAFAALRAAAPEDLRMAAAIWVHLHEHFHCGSPLSIDRYPKLKGSRLSGAFEELRVDLAAALADLHGVVPAHLEQVVFEFILSFRLIYYGSSFSPDRDYDAITSVAMGNRLLEAGVIREEADGRYALDDAAQLRAGMQDILDKLEGTEARLTAEIAQGDGGVDAQLRLRVVFEQLMLRWCKASDVRSIQRNDFLAHHSAALGETQPVPLAVG